MKLPVAIERNAKLIIRKIYQNRADITFFGGMALTMVGTGLCVKATSDIQPVHLYREGKRAARVLCLRSRRNP